MCRNLKIESCKWITDMSIQRDRSYFYQIFYWVSILFLSKIVNFFQTLRSVTFNTLKILLWVLTYGSLQIADLLRIFFKLFLCVWKCGDESARMKMSGDDVSRSHINIIQLCHLKYDLIFSEQIIPALLFIHALV